MVKIALLSLYRRIFCTHVFRVKTLIVGCACVTWCLLALLLDIFQCSPIEDAFLPQYLFTDKCIDLQWYYWGTGGTNLLLDVVMLYLPVHMVWGLQLQTRQKALLTGVFSLGGFVLIAGAMRISSIGVLQKEDISVSGAVFYLWSQVEPATAIICASIVTYRPLFTNIHIPSRFPSFSSLLRSKTTSSGSSSGGLGASKHSDGGWNALGSRDHDPLARPNRRHDAEGQFGNIQKKTRIEISSRAYEPDVWESTVETRSHSATVEMF
ncbi:hypothetical protein MMC21_006821 [Puttea exsequens]|nr:hypothetical protein [Puttea exsequens]